MSGLNPSNGYMRGMKAFVTGAGGYIGIHLIEQLKEAGYEVRGLARNPARLSNLASLGAEPVLGDIGKMESIAGYFEGVDVVFHLAGVMVGSEREITRTNVEGTKNMVEAAASAGVRNFVFASTASVYGGHGEELVTEKSACNPMMPYARSKFEAERFVAERSGEDFNGAVCRMGGVYGPKSQMLMLESGGRTQVRLVGSGDNWISVIHVEDAAAALLAAAKNSRPGEIYNICDSEPVRLKNFYNYLAARLGSPEAKYLSEATAKRIAQVVGFYGRVTGRAVVFNADFVKTILSSLKLSNEKARRELDFHPKYPDYRTGIDSILRELGMGIAV